MAIGDWELTFIIRDSEGHTAPVELHLDSSLQLADVAGIATAFTPILLNMIDGTIAKITGANVIDLSSTLPVTETNVEQAAKFIWRVNDTTKVLQQVIPTFKSALIVPGDNRVDQAAAAITAYMNAMTAGGIGAEIGGNPEANAPRDTENRLLGSLKTATEWWGKLRKKKG